MSVEAVPSDPHEADSGHASAAPSISVVVCAYTEERWNALVAAVDSIRRQTVPALESLVVVDHDPVLLARAREAFAGVPNVRVLENAGDRGLSEARNTGVRAARGGVVAFLDDDAVADDDWLEELAGHYADPSVVAVGGAIEPAWVGGRPKSFPPEFDWVVGCTYAGLPETATAVRNVIGANMSFRRQVVEDVGGFDPRMGRTAARPLGCEETELCLRVKRRWPDSVIVYEPLARVRHSVSPARETWGYFVRRCYAEGLSKASVARLAGASLGLRSERRYLARTVPRGILVNVAGSISERDVSLLARATRMVLGVFVTTTGYCIGSIRAL